MRIIAFFNNKGGVGKTTLLYHIAHMLAEQGERVLVADLDPQANATSMFLDEDTLIELWPDGDHPYTIHGALKPIISGTGDVLEAHVENVAIGLGLVVGDLALSRFEDRLSDAWPRCHNRDEHAFRTMTAFYRSVTMAARNFEATWVLMDVGPNLGAINRAALIASEHVIVPLGPDLFSLQGLRNLGPTLQEWRDNWAELRPKSTNADIELPSGRISPLGYVVLQHGIRDNRPPKAYQRWINKFPEAYRTSVLNEPDTVLPESAKADPYCLATIKHYRSLMPMAIQARKPVFALKPADGAIGAHGAAVRSAGEDFGLLADIIRLRVAEQSILIGA
jgi:cellulose biosynthesis protein BcsQ